jgi:DNA-binding NarL/FixJ family response regulator
VTSIRVLLVDDHALVRAGIRSLLEKVESLEIIGETDDGRLALELIEKHRPDIVLLDLMMHGLSGFEVLKISREKFPEVQIIVITFHEEEAYALHALRSGAAGYLPKTAAIAELRLAIDYVMGGKKYLSPSVEQKAAGEFGHYGKQSRTVAVLTPRQREVLILIAEGRTTKEIGQELNISVKTVESHRGQLMDRLNIHDIAGLVRYAIKFGLASIENSSPPAKMRAD